MDIKYFWHSNQKVFFEFGNFVVVRNSLHQDQRGLLQQGNGGAHDDDHNDNGQARVHVLKRTNTNVKQVALIFLIRKQFQQSFFLIRNLEVKTVSHMIISFNDLA